MGTSKMGMFNVKDHAMCEPGRISCIPTLQPTRSTRRTRMVTGVMSGNQGTKTNMVSMAVYVNACKADSATRKPFGIIVNDWG